jgi:predicted secreted protein
MDWFTGIAVFLTIWWVVLFAVLPLGARSQKEAGDVVPGTDPGAPVLPDLRRKLVITTGVAAAFWVVLAVVIGSGLVSLERPLGGLIPSALPESPAR